MARLARIVIPDVAHHVVQRGNRRQPIFFADDDRACYLDLVAEGCAAAGVRCLAWCLMDNHVHLILVPADADGLRAAVADAHRRYTSRINRREGWCGYLFQGRFASYPMDDAHRMTAIRYVERNPVAAGLVAHAEDWRWSSARSHIAGRRVGLDRLTDVSALCGHVPEWRAMLRYGLEAGDVSGEGEAIAATIEARLRSGRPLGSETWIAGQEIALARPLRADPRGPKPKRRMAASAG
ncbi:transposase [Allosphingosinicella deserti]|uniref:Transposase n=1 Tax=Allosphingosinicella deserti TaxID=2116704 RepID=A0A2P7QFA5_9SPHN|nr:transposase [Sphingomonas deserti]PSJ36643.1 transposase [Sphingomonas deserti]